jgi:xylulokinase
MSDAAGTAWLDVGQRDWSDDLLAATDLGRDHMPELTEGSSVSAGLSQSLATQWGMNAGIPVAGGGGDNAATAVGLGVIKPGTAFLSLGTSGVIFAATDNYSPAPETAVHSFCHALPDTWHQMGVILSCTDALNWFGGLTGKTPAELTAQMTKITAPGRAMFLPYLGGERTPHNDATIRGAMIGLENETDLKAGTQAVLEGVGFALRDSLDALSATGTDVANLIAVGGGSQSSVWLEMLATILQRPIDVPVSGEFGAAFGAARLGMMADTSDLTLASAPKIARQIAPNSDLVEDFQASHQRYKATYSALKDLT